MTQYIIGGKIISPHSLNGNIIIASFLENTEDIFTLTIFDENKNICPIKKISHINKNQYIAHINKYNNLEIINRTQAEMINKQYLYIQKPSLQDDIEFLASELININVKDINMNNIGKVYDFENINGETIIYIQKDKIIFGVTFSKQNFPTIVPSEYIIFVEDQDN